MARSSALRPTPNLEDQVSLFMSPSDRVGQLYPKAPGSLFVALYDSQGYGGGILTRLHMGSFLICYFKFWKYMSFCYLKTLFQLHSLYNV
jgi:hypothetical protein